MAITKIATVTVGAGGASTIDFNSIPGIYTDLLIVTSIRSALASGDSSDGVFMTFNGNTSGYSTRDLYGDGANGYASVNPYGRTNATYVGSTSAAGSTADTFGTKSIYIANYAGATNKSVNTESAQERNASNPNYLEMLYGLWSNTAAITSLSLSSANSSSWVQHSSATLYGVTKGSSGGTTVS